MRVKKTSVVSYLLGLLAVLFISSSCGDNYLEDDMLPDPGSSTKEITRFTVNGVDGAITGTSIALTLPFGTDLTNLTPTVVHTGASVSPASGAAQNFTGPVTYTVTAVDGSTQAYQVAVTAAPSDAKDITRFTLLGIDGTISGTSITLTLPFGTNLTSLAPAIVHTGASISPNSGVAQDFGAPVQYTVTAADGSTKAYTVTVSVALSDAKDITRFTILGVDGTITGTSISLTLPFGTSLASLTPTIIHTGASITPASGAAQSFSAPVQYTVTAADGSTKVYTVTVNVALSSAKDITQFTILGVDGTISGTSITLTLPFGTNLTSLVPTIVHTGAMIAPNSGVAQNFSTPVMYIVTAADGTVKTYTVTVSVALSSAKDITQFTILGVNGTISGTSISLTLPFGTSLTSLTPTIVHTGASISPLGGVPQDFSAPVQYTVTASDGSTKTYTVNVGVAASSSKDITQFTILGVNGTIAGTSITLTLPFGTNVSALVPTILHTGASVSPASGVAQNFSGPVQYTVTADDGSTKVYTVTVSVALSSSKDITRFTVLGLDATILGTNITLTLPFGTDLSSLTPTIVHTGASVSPASGVAQNFTTQRQYTVTADDGSTQVYTVTITTALNNSKDIIEFRILGSQGFITGTNILVVLPFGTPLSSLSPTVVHTGVSVSPASGVFQNFTSPVLYTVTAADGSTKTYTVTVVNALNNAKDITSFVINGVPGVIAGTDITVTLPLNTVVTALAPTIAHTGVSVTPASGVPQDFTNPVQYVVAAADGSTKTYTARVIAPQLVTIEITPIDPSIAKGTDQQFVATGKYADNSTQTITAMVVWGSSDTNVATITAGGLASGDDQGTTTISATLAGITGTTTLTVTAAALVSIDVTPPSATIAKGTDRQFTATGTYTDNTTQDISSSVTWTTGSGAIASVSATGLAHGEGVGMTTVTATDGLISGSASLNVTAATLATITVTPPSKTIAKGTDQQYTATGTLTDGTTQNLTTQVIWDSSNTVTATILSSGLAHANNQGTTTITATLGAISGSTQLTVSQAELVSIAVTPFDPSIAKGTDKQFTATGTYTDGTTQPLTATASWSSSMPGVATVSSGAGTQGLAHGVNVGTTTITATVGTVSGSTTLEVTAATLVSIAVTPINKSIAKGTDEQYTAIGTYTDGNTQDLTDTATWGSSMPSIATISSATGSEGLAHAVNTGTTTISATVGTVTGTTQLTVTMATLVSIAVTPPNASSPKGADRQFTATGTYTDNTTQNLTTQVTWSSSMPGVATISSAAGSQGLAHAEAVGTTTITATLGLVSGSTSFNVTAAALVSIEVTPASSSTPKGNDRQFTATGTYTDGTTLDITADVTWMSSMTGVATISNALGSKGEAHAVATGTTTISATLGAITGSAQMTVTAAVLVSIEVIPFDPTMPKGTTRSFSAEGTFSDGTTQDLTTSVTWSTTNSAVADVSNAGGSQGLVTAVDTGTATIRATEGAIFGESEVTVVTPVLVSITVNPPNPSIALGTNQGFTATGTFSDNSALDITQTVLWTSSMTGVATISNAAGSKGLASSVATGQTTITATSGAITGSTTLTVTAATLVRIEVTPANASLPRVFDEDYTATGVYSDATLVDLTDVVTWSSSATNVATVSNAAATKGTVSTLNAGTTTITALDPLTMVAGSTQLTVTNGVLMSITVTPDPTTIAIGARVKFTATGNYTDGVSRDITNQVSWSTNGNSIVNVSNGRKKRGIATGKKAGTVTVTATLGGISGTASLTVSTATLVSITVLPANTTIPNGTKQFFQAIGTFSDSTTSDLTAAVSWSSTVGSVATISNQPFKEGQATAQNAGSTTIQAFDQATGITGMTTLTVSNATLVSIEVTPAGPTVIIGFPQQLTATATYSDATTKDVTKEVAWTSSNGGIASISNATPTQGLLSGFAAGTITATAQYPLTNVSGSTTVNVIP